MGMFDHLETMSRKSFAKRVFAMVLIVAVGCSIAVYSLNKQTTDHAAKDSKTLKTLVVRSANQAKAVTAISTVACERRQAVYAYLIIDAGRNKKQPILRQRAAERVFPFIDCEGSLGAGRTVYLPDFKAKKLIDSVAKDVGYPNWDISH